MKDCMEFIGIFIIVLTVICTISAFTIAWQYWRFIPDSEKTGGNRLRFMAIIAGIILSALGSSGFGSLLVVMGEVARAIERIAARDQVLDSNKGAIESS